MTATPASGLPPRSSDLAFARPLRWNVSSSMEAIAQLEQEYFLLKVGVGNLHACIDWAIERLRQNQEGDDREIVLLAAATEQEEVTALVEKIITRYRGIHTLDEQLAAGKYMVSLRDAYIQGKETIESIDAKLTRLYQRLGYPDWLTMLSRNCEYATDVPAFKEPFEQEFAYIAELWKGASSTDEFEAQYSRAVSSQHDAKYC